MRRTKSKKRSASAARAAALGLFLIAASSCSDGDDDQAPPASGAPSSAGEAGEGGAFEPGGAGAGAESGTGAGGSGGRPGNPEEPCVRDSDCDDLVFCNGREICEPKFPGADVAVCMRPERGPCADDLCIEEERRCDCSVRDVDGDGAYMPGCTDQQHPQPDCDDNDPRRFPDAQEICDPNDLESRTSDEDCDDETYGFIDEDQDSFYDEDCSNPKWLQPVVEGPVLLNQGNDCDDTDPTFNPRADDRCDGYDNDCNRLIDDLNGTPPEEINTYYPDEDRDGAGNGDEPLEIRCDSPPAGYVHDGGDCDDDNEDVHPGQTEVCNGINDDCDDTTDQPFDGDLLPDEPLFPGVTLECDGENGWIVAEDGCPQGRGDCNEDYSDACEKDLTTLCNCADCGNKCAFSCGGTGCEEIADVTTGSEHTCAIARESASLGGSVVCWGSNSAGQLGNGTNRGSDVPVRVLELTNVTAVAAGNNHSCAIVDGLVSCWGSNLRGQLGIGTTDDGFSFPINALPPFGAEQAERIASGAFHTCAIYDGGRLACWGQNDFGQLGNGDQGDGVINRAPTPVKRELGGQYLDIINASQVTAGESHTCALSEGIVECWGANFSGQLGREVQDPPVARSVPGLDGLTVDEIRASGFHTCARAGFRVYCWGSNEDGELALEAVERAPPTRIPLPEDVVSIATGLFFGCALGASGQIHCWGSSEFGERGTNGPALGVAPNPLPLEGVADLFAGGGKHLCALAGSSQLSCWGRNKFGQLGIGRKSDGQEPLATAVVPLNGPRVCVND